MVTDNDRFGHEGNLFTGMDYTKNMTIPAWPDREEYLYEPHFFTTPAGTMQRWYGSKMPAILFRRRSTDELIGGIRDLIRG